MIRELGILGGLMKAAARSKKERAARTAAGALIGYGAGRLARRGIVAAHRISSSKPSKRLLNRLGPLAAPAALGVHFLPVAGVVEGGRRGFKS